jgi:hypothetical protein
MGDFIREQCYCNQKQWIAVQPGNLFDVAPSIARAAQLFSSPLGMGPISW